MSMRRLTVLTIALGSCTSALSHAADCETAAGTLVSVQGAVTVMGAVSAQWRDGRIDEILCQGDTIQVGQSSRAAISLINNTVLRIDQNTTLRLVDIPVEPQQRSWIELLKGAIQSFSRKPRLLTINTPYLNGSIEGTEFVFRVTETEALLSVFEGTVVAVNEHGRMAVPGGSAVIATMDDAPQPRLVAKPRGEAEWALYYPPVSAAGRETAATAESGSMQDLQLAERYLAVGRVDEARALIDQVLAKDPRSGKAYALRAVIDVVQNQTDKALDDGEQAAALDEGTSGDIALSYARQANFQLIAARDGIRAALEEHPDDALVWARLAELELMLGGRRTALEAALKSESIAPDLARNQLVLGFADLAVFDNEGASRAFARARQLDSADPLTLLGLGLSKISSGELASGRADIEAAVALDGSSALLRAYLGKAYFEEKRAPLDEQQFTIAKDLDPNDPTAYFYDSLAKQSVNRPVEALDDLQKSIELNDNRAVYRSRLLLDKDRAARGASLARIYNDLGFVELGTIEAARSLATDPADAAAHRFISDVYLSERRREIARVSELLQAQMFQDINTAPLQPSSSEANLNIITLGGPSNAGFNEFTPLFLRNRTQLALTGLTGTDNTRNLEAALSGNFGHYSFGLGGLSYDTDGWRPNNTLEQDLYNLFAQVSLSDRMNVQAEFRNRKSTEGDLAFNFDPDDFQADKTTDREQDTGRIGLRYSATPDSHFFLSYIHGHRTEQIHEVQQLPPVVGETTFTNNQDVDEKSDLVEAQYLHGTNGVNLYLGAAWSESDRVDDADVSIDDTILGNLFSAVGQDKLPSKDPRAYLYLNLHASAAVLWTLGASYEKFEQGDYEDTNFNPKLGVQWNLGHNAVFRAAALQTVKPVLVNNRTLEPTQVAGFNQLFDDINGTRSRNYGVGMDWRVSRSSSAGVQFTRRSLDEPLLDINAGNWITEERQELLHKLYWDWTLSSRVAMHSELTYDRYESEQGIATADSNLPEKVETWSLPVALNFFHPTGFFTGAGAAYVDQTVLRSETATQASGDDQFTTVDISMGYRFHRRSGLASLAIQNLLDTEFNYQDDSYREFRDEPSIGPYFPVRTIVGRIVLNY